MYPTSDAFRAAIQGSHTVLSRAEVWSGNTFLRSLDLSGGSVTASAKSGTRRTCQVQTLLQPGDALIAGSAFDPLSPYGNEVRVWRGVQFSDGTEEMVPLGVFVIQAIEYQATASGVSVSISGVDRSQKVAQNRWTGPFQATGSTALATNLTRLLQDRWPGVTLAFTPQTTPTTQQQVFGIGGGNDPWKDAVEYAQKAGYDLYFDRSGACVLEPLPDVDAIEPRRFYVEGESSVLIDVTRSDSVEETYNGVVYIAEGSGIDTPLRAEAWDSNPASPTYRFGNFGQKPYIVSQSAISDATTADRAVKALLSQYLGASQSIRWTGLVDPSLDPNDAVYVESSATSVAQTLILDELTIPLAATDAMQATARTIRTGVI